MNALERAVIDAARVVRREGAFARDEIDALMEAVKALEEHERAQAGAGLAEIPWAQVAEGDQLRGKSGAFFPVTATKREWQLGKPTGNFLITVQLPAGPRTLIRPNGAEPMATVRRGDAGKAVDMFVNVFTSGEA